MVNDTRSRSVLYESIQSQPAVIRSVLERHMATAERAADRLAHARRVVLAGTGTSGHAAIVGEHLLRLAGADAQATTLFDFATYPRALDPADVLIAISHRGSKRYGARAIETARAAGLTVIGVTGMDSPMVGADLLLDTAPQERSSTHSASYTASLTALALIAAALGRRTGAEVDALRSALDRLPAIVASMLAREDAIRPVAAWLAARGRLFLAGAGPHAATAREGALKVKESSYLTAEGFELETALHGALPAVERGDVAVAIVADGPATDRSLDLVTALRLLETRLLVIADERVVPRLPGPSDGTLVVLPYPAVPESLGALPATIPLQLLADHTAALRGTDADCFRADDPLHKRAHDSYAL